MGGKKKMKKKCCGKFKKKGKHCSSCPITGSGKKCVPDKDFCKGCEVAVKKKKTGDKKKKKKQAGDKKKTKKKK